MTIMITYPVYREGKEVQVHVQYIHSAQCGIRTCTQIPHDFSYDHTIKSSGAILQARSGSTAWHETHNCLWPVFLRSHHDLQKVYASGHNAKQSFRYLVTIRKLTTPGLTEKRKSWLRLEGHQMAVNRDEEAWTPALGSGVSGVQPMQFWSFEKVEVAPIRDRLVASWISGSRIHTLNLSLYFNTWSPECGRLIRHALCRDVEPPSRLLATRKGE